MNAKIWKRRIRSKFCRRRKQRKENIKPWNPKADFDLAFKLLPICAITFGIFQKRPLLKRLVTYFEVTFDIVLVYVMSLELRVSIYTASSPVYTCCALATTSFIIVLRLWFFFSGSKILSLATHFDECHEAMSKKAKSVTGFKNFIISSYVACIAFTILIIFLVTNRMHTSNHGRKYLRLITGDFDTVSVNNELILTVITQCVVFSEGAAYTTYLLALLLCCIFYAFLKRLFGIFILQLLEDRAVLVSASSLKGTKKGKTLFKDCQKRISTVVSNSGIIRNEGTSEFYSILHKNNETFQKLKRLANDADDTMSLCSFCLVGLSVSSIFETQSMSMSTDSFANETMMNAAFKFVLTIVAFFVVCSLSFAGSKVSTAAEEIRESVKRLAIKIAGDVHDLTFEELVQMLMFMNSCNTTEIHMTGWQMFNVNKSLILTVAGALVTYGVLIDQMVKQNNLQRGLRNDTIF